MHTRRASHASARPLNCGVRRSIMSVALGLTMYIVLAAALPIWFAYSRRVLFVSDVALLLASPLLFYLSGVFLNRSWELGLGAFFYPFVAAGVAVALLWFRVFVVDSMVANPRRSSKYCLAASVVLAVVGGAVIPPLYE